MGQCRARLEPTTLVSVKLCIISGFIGVACAQAILARLKVISGRQVSGVEHATQSLPGDDQREYVIRFRLEVVSDEGLYVLAMGPVGTPLFGQTCERARGSMLNDSSMSMDSKPFCSKPGEQSSADWKLLPGGSAYEWGMEGGHSKPGYELSRSVRFRRRIQVHPAELVSSWHTIGDEPPGWPVMK